MDQNTHYVRVGDLVEIRKAQEDYTILIMVVSEKNDNIQYYEVDQKEIIITEPWIDFNQKFVRIKDIASEPPIQPSASTWPFWGYEPSTDIQVNMKLQILSDLSLWLVVENGVLCLRLMQNGIMGASAVLNMHLAEELFDMLKTGIQILSDKTKTG